MELLTLHWDGDRAQALLVRIHPYCVPFHLHRVLSQSALGEADICPEEDMVWVDAEGGLGHLLQVGTERQCQVNSLEGRLGRNSVELDSGNIICRAKMSRLLLSRKRSMAFSKSEVTFSQEFDCLGEE